MDTLLQIAFSFHSNHSLSITPSFSNKFSHYQVRFSIRLRNRRALNPNIAMAQNPSFQQEKILIPNKEGDRLVGILHESQTKEIVVLCHGLTSSKEDTTMKNVATALQTAGITSFRFDFTGNGESEGSFVFGNYWREVDDLHAVNQNFLQANRPVVAIIGHSKGGNIVLLYASKYHDIKTVVNLSGRYDLKRGLEGPLGKDFMERIRKEGFIEVKTSSGVRRVTEECLKDRLSITMHDECLKIDKDCRFLTVHGNADTTIPVEDALEFAKILPNNELQIIEGADHVFTHHQNQVASVVVNYLKKTLQLDKINAS